MPPEKPTADAPLTALTLNPKAAQESGEDAVAQGNKAQEVADLRAKVQKGLDDIASGRVSDFDAERIIAKGERSAAAAHNR
jgi:hypothetical protein